MVVRRCVTKDAVFTIAQSLVNEGLLPTQAKVRENLGFGSMHTIHCYLQEWKQKCFAANKATPLLQEELTSATLELDSLEQGKKSFDKIKLQLQQQIASLTAELKAVEQRANKWEYQAETLQAELVLQTVENNKLLAQYQNCQERLLERERNLELFIQDKNQLITSLRQEMKETAEQAVKEAREYNHRQHDSLLKLQVENMNLQQELKLVSKKTKEHEEQVLTLKLSVGPLKRELQEKEAIINTYVSKEQLEAYARNNSK